MFSKMGGRLGYIKVRGIHVEENEYPFRGLLLLLIMSCRKSQSTCPILTSLSQMSISHFDKEKADFGS